MDGRLRLSFIIAERTGRTLQELYNGGPQCEPMTGAEFTQWEALITVVEPYERDQAK